MPSAGRLFRNVISLIRLQDFVWVALFGVLAATSDILDVYVLAPLAALLPAATVLNYWNEDAFNKQWAVRVLDQLEGGPIFDPASLGQPALEEGI